MSDFEQKLRQILKDEPIRRNEPMRHHTTFRVGGPADYYVEPQTPEKLADVLKLCRQWNIPYFILGNGSNLLVGDRGFRGVMIVLGKPWQQVTATKSGIRAGAGVLLATAARYALEHALAGLEFASGIPGTVGGAVVMNAGAYGQEMKDVLSQVVVLTREGEIKTRQASELELGYRSSCILKEDLVVLEAEFALEPGNRTAIGRRMEELAARRREKQPLEYPSAGSTFKRPFGHFAGKLIEEAGLRGFGVGDAQVSEKHCGFVINRGNATAADIQKLCSQIQKRVKENSGVELELEVKLLGEF